MSVILLWYQCRINLFFNDSTTSEIYTLSLHDALPISRSLTSAIRLPVSCGATGTTAFPLRRPRRRRPPPTPRCSRDRKSTRLNSSHSQISYAVFCLKKKKNQSSRFYH